MECYIMQNEASSSSYMLLVVRQHQINKRGTCVYKCVLGGGKAPQTQGKEPPVQIYNSDLP